MARAIKALGPLTAVVAASAVGTALSPGPAARLDPALAWAGPCSGRPLGSGEAGVNLLAVLTRAELRAIALAAAVALSGWAIGVPLGGAAALVRGRFERAVGRACDLVQAFPTFMLALVVMSAVREPSRVAMGVIFALTAWAPFARLSLAETRVLRGAAFVEAAIALGRAPASVVLHHLVPNLSRSAAVQLGSSAAAVVVSEAALSFLGFGPRDGVSLGGILDQGVAAMLIAPHVLAVGGASVLLTSVALLAAGQWFD